MKTIFKTNYSKSPIVVITTTSNNAVRLAIDNDGNIYRYIGRNEELVTVEEFEVNLSEKTEKMIAEYLIKYSYMGSSRGELACKIEIQKWLQKGCAYVSYNVHHEPLHSLDVSRYYDVMELANKQERIIAYQKTIDNLRNFGTENEKAIKKIIAEREKVAAKN